MKSKKEECPYIETVICDPDKKHCETCGWNPKVAERRLAKIKKQRRRGKV